MRNALIVSAVACAAAWAVNWPAAAQTLPAAPKLQSLQADLQAAKDREAEIATLISQRVERSKMLLTQHVALADQAKALQPEGETLRKDLEAVNADAEKQHAAAAKHNAQCPHETTEAALVVKCNEAMTHLNAWASKDKAELARLATAKETYEKKLTEIAEHDKKIVAELADLRANDTSQRKQLAEVHDRVATLLTDVATARAQCKALEKAPADPANAAALEACRAAKENALAPAPSPETK